MAIHKRSRRKIRKYENKGASIPVESRTCLFFKENYIEDEQHFLKGITTSEANYLHFLISKTDAHFATVSDYDKITYLLNLGSDNTCKLVGKYNHLMFQKRKEITNTNIIK